MSWDISVMKFSQAYASVEVIPNTESCVSLGPSEFVRRAISECFPGTDWRDPKWGTFDCEHGSVEFNMSDKEPNQGFALHVRASAEIVPRIVSLLNQHGWQGLDCSTGDFLERAVDPEAGLAGWASYRDRVVGDV